MSLTQCRKIGIALVEHVGLVEVAVGRGRSGTDQVIIVIRSYLAGHHVLTGVFIATVTGEALLVPIVDNREAAAKVHQRVGQLHAVNQFSV